MTGPPGDNRGVSTVGRLIPRLLSVGVLALALVGMHHLVVAACHQAAGHSAHGSTLAVSTSHDHAAPDSAPMAPLPAPLDAPDAPGGLVGAAATCLAILLMVVGLVLPRLLARLRHLAVRDRSLGTTRVFFRPVAPPDLTLLSVSRT